MAQFRKDTQEFIGNNKTIYEVNMMASGDGSLISNTNPFPVTLGSENITITGSVNVGTVVEVSSNTANPVHNHISEVGTSGILTNPYLPVNIVNDSGQVNSNSSPLFVSVTDFPVSQTIDGSVSVSNFPASQTIDGTVSLQANTTVSVDNFPAVSSIKVSTSDDNTQLDAAGRFRISLPGQQWWYQPSVDKDGDLRFQEAFTGTAAGSYWIQNLASVHLTSGTDSNGSAIRISRRRHKIRPGIAHQWYAAVNFDGIQQNVKKQIGMFTQYNGVFLEVTDDLYVVVRRRLMDSTVTETRVKRDQFVYDKLDGTGPSGFNFTSSRTLTITGHVSTTPVSVGSTTVYNVVYNTAGTAADKFPLGSKVLVTGVTPTTYNNCPMVVAINDAGHTITLCYGVNPGSYVSMSSGLLTNNSFINIHGWYIDFDGSRTNRVRFGIEGPQGPVVLHALDFGDTLGSQFESAPALTERTVISNTGSVIHLPSITISSTSFNIEAETELSPGFGVAANNTGVSLTIGQEYPILGVGLRAGEPYQRGDVQIQSITVVDSANIPGKNVDGSLLYWRLLLNPTIGGTVPSPTNIGKASRQWSYTTATTISGGIELVAGYATSGQVNDLRTALNFLNMGSNVDNTDADKVVLMVKLLKAGSTATSSVVGNINYIESL